MNEITTKLDAVTAFAGNSTDIYAAKASGLYRSQEDGQSWVCLTDDTVTGGSAVTAIEMIDETIFAGLNGAILHSDDAGQNWQLIALANPPPLLSTIIASPNYRDDGTIFAGTAEDGVFVSTDFGLRWTPWNFGLIDMDVNCLALSPDFASNKTLYAGTETGLFFSQNTGKSWHSVPFPTEFAPILCLAMTQNGIMFAGTDYNGLFVSDDAGQNWSSLPTSETDDNDTIHSIQVNHDALFILTDTNLVQLHLSDYTSATLKTFTDEQQPLALIKTGSYCLTGYVDGHIDVI